MMKISAKESRTLHELSSTTGSTASQVANRTGVSASTARKHLAELRAQGLARRDNVSGEWFAVHEPTAEKPAEPKPQRERKPRKPVPEATPDAELETQLAASFDKTADLLRGLGFRDKVAELDGSLVDLLRDAGPLSREEVAEKLTLPTWSFRRMTEGKHGDLRFDPLVEVVGRGDDRKYQAVR